MTNQIAVDFIKTHEGCKLTAYQDSALIWTVGYGATGLNIQKDTVWTQAQADARLVKDVSEAEVAVRKLVRQNLSAQSQAAIISFVFNLGEGAFEHSTLLSFLNDGDFLAAAKEFIRWDHASGRELRGLLIRRLEEAALFLKGVS